MCIYVAGEGWKCSVPLLQKGSLVCPGPRGIEYSEILENPILPLYLYSRNIVLSQHLLSIYCPSPLNNKVFIQR